MPHRGIIYMLRQSSGCMIARISTSFLNLCGQLNPPLSCPHFFLCLLYKMFDFGLDSPPDGLKLIIDEIND